MGPAIDLMDVTNLAVDEVHQRVFLAGGSGDNRILATNYAGSVQAEFAEMWEPEGMALSTDSSRLYVTLDTTGEIAEINTANLAVVHRFQLGAPCLGPVGYAGGRVWFVHNCGRLGWLNPATGQIELNVLQVGWHVLTDPAKPNQLVVVGDSVHVVDISVDPPTQSTWPAPSGCGADGPALVDGGDRITFACLDSTMKTFDVTDGSPAEEWPTAIALRGPSASVGGRYVAVGSEDAASDLFVYDRQNLPEPVRAQDIGGPTQQASPWTIQWTTANQLFFTARDNFSPWRHHLYVIADAHKRATELELDPPTTRPDLAQPEVSGRFTSEGSALAGRSLDVTRTTTFGSTTLADVVTGPDGTFTFTDDPGTGTAVTYTVTYPGDDTYAIASDSVRIRTRTLPFDVNGDGYAELAAGAVTEDLASIRDAGIFHVLPSGPSGITGSGSRAYTQDTTGVPDVSQSGDQLGYTQASGDFNADGYADVAVSANAEDLGSVRNSGLVHVFYGSSTGLRTDNSTTLSLANTGYGARTDAFFGDALAVGDFNRDGRSDLAIGTDGFGRVFVAKGSAAGLSPSMSVFSQDTSGVPGVHKSNDLFGFALSAADVNGDSRDDLAIGAPWDWEDRGWATGSVTVLYGASGGLSGSGAQRWSKDSSGIIGGPGGFGSDMPDSFGFQVALADCNGDGYADLAAAAPGAIATLTGSFNYQDGGTVNVIYGSATKLNSTGNHLRTQATTGIPGEVETRDYFGITLAAGDANGDGKAELAITTAGDYNVTILPGASRFASIIGAKAWSQNSTGVAGTTESEDGFGASLRFAYFKGGLYAGLAIGIPGEDGGKGAVEVLHGGSSGLTASGSQYLTQDTAGVPDVAQAGDWFGTFY